MAVEAAQVSVGTSATSVFAAGVGGARVTVQNTGGTSVFLGGSGVTTGDGYELESSTPRSAVTLELEPEEELFGIVATGTETVHVISG